MSESAWEDADKEWLERRQEGMTDLEVAADNAYLDYLEQQGL